MNSKIIIEPEKLEVVKRILKKQLPLHAKVWVFGSRVKGKIKKFSDLDLAIDLNGEPIALDILANLTEEFDESILPYKVDVVDWNMISENFKNLIKKDCVLLDY